MIEDIQDLAKFNNQNFSINPEKFEVRQLVRDTLFLFDRQCEFKGVELK